MENFKPIQGWPGYEVGDKGTVVSLNYNHTGKRHALEPKPYDKLGHVQVSLYRKGEKPVHRKVHQLVAEAFIGPCPDGLVINHIDSNPANNRADNLEYITQKANSNTPHCKAAMSKANDWKKRKVVVLDGDGEPFCIFESINEAATTLGLNSGHIWGCCNGKYRHTGGFQFRWWK